MFAVPHLIWHKKPDHVDSQGKLLSRSCLTVARASCDCKTNPPEASCDHQTTPREKLSLTEVMNGSILFSK